MAKPVHPAFVHFPIAFILLANGLDIVNAFRGSLPGVIASNLLVANEMTRASYYLLAIGLVTCVPAVISGGGDAMKLFTKQGMYEADGKTIKTKVKATIAHALISDAQIALATYVWFSKRSAANNTLAGKAGVGSVGTATSAYAPEPWMLAAEAASTLLLAVGSNIGGTLTYGFGVGLSAGSNSATAGNKKTK